MAAILKCKMCGGDLKIQQGDLVAECLYCGSKQTLPNNLSDEKRANLYERANKYRFENEFDKAYAIYEQIVSEDNTDAEAYWSLVLCKYGIEYVEDPSTKKRVPTINRAQYTSVYDNEDYKQAVKHATPEQVELYKAEAEVIDKIQQNILSISSKEEPFDVFICYKETDERGSRTPDSVIAYDLYKELIKEGHRVFFARVTLEDKLGTAYEPYIFAALNSARIMLVVGTNANNMNSVWVRNEWSRFLYLMQSDSSKTMIPVYKDMEPYNMPPEFAHLQAQDMNKIGAMQDVLHGINKLLSKSTSKSEENGKPPVSVTIESLLKRAEQLIAAKEWNNAIEYCNKILESDPECYKAHFYLFLSQIKAQTVDEIVNGNSNPCKYSNYLNAVKYAPQGEQNNLKNIQHEYERNHKLKRKKAKLIIGISLFLLILIGAGIFYIPKELQYKDALKKMSNKDYLSAHVIFISLSNYKNSVKYSKMSEIAKCDIGDSFFLGSYEQDNDYSNGKESIEWVVIATENDKKLVITKYCLDCQPYNDFEHKYEYWDKSKLRDWLNSLFLDNAFTNNDLEYICDSAVITPVKSRYVDSSEVNTSEDKVFLLSREEAEKYFSDDTRKAIATEHCISQGVRATQSGYCRYWLREAALSATYVLENGMIIEKRLKYEAQDISVRPAMWVSIEN